MGEMAPRPLGPDWGEMEDAGDAITGGAAVSPAADTTTGFLPRGRAHDGEAGLGAGTNRYNPDSAQHAMRSDAFMNARMYDPEDPDRLEMDGYRSRASDISLYLDSADLADVRTDLARMRLLEQEVRDRETHVRRVICPPTPSFPSPPLLPPPPQREG